MFNILEKLKYKVINRVLHYYMECKNKKTKLIARAQPRGAKGAETPPPLARSKLEKR